MDGNSALRILKWHKVVEKLNAEGARYSYWKATVEQVPSPQRPYYSELMRAMEMAGEQEFDKTLSKIRLYADCVLQSHNRVLELRERAGYDKLLKVLKEGKNSTDSVLS